MIPRDYRTTGLAIGQNLRTFIENHPDRFHILLYAPDWTHPEQVAVNDDVVGAIEGMERTLTYWDPMEAVAVKIPDGAPYEVTDQGDHADGYQTDAVILLINVDDVPKQSVIQYEEYSTATDRRLVSLYVEKSDLIGQAPGVGQKHYCIPFPQFMAVHHGE